MRPCHIVFAGALFIIGLYDASGAPDVWQRHVVAARPASQAATEPKANNTHWVRHAVDDFSKGADGVRLADVNGDGLLDIATGWEQGGLTRVYLHPGHAKVGVAWPAITVGKATSVEDAVFADLDGDGAIDVISCCEGKTRTVFVHWAPKNPKQYVDSSAWKTEPIPCTKDLASWMFALPMQIDGKNGIDLIVGAKGTNAVIGWLQAPADPRKLSDWKFHKIRDAGWIMSLVAHDVNNDGRLDVIVSDRKGKNSEVLWLENPGPDRATAAWTEHRIGVRGREVMFLDVGHIDDDKRADIAVAVKPNEIHLLRQPAKLSDPWQEETIKVEMPTGLGNAKAVAIGDINGDGKVDLVYTCEGAVGDKRGAVWLEQPKEKNGKWTVHDVSGPDGIKFDRIEVLDLDGDGDLDILTCEESEGGKGLGVIWYENPLRSPSS